VNRGKSSLHQDCLGQTSPMAKDKPDLVYGTLDMLILKALQHEPRHGLGIADRIQQMSQDILRVEQGSLYPALYRLEAQGWIKAEWGVSENNRKARYYRLTAAGRKQLTAETEHWARITEGINLVLGET
jgi:PadR family transcriptional regulator